MNAIVEINGLRKVYQRGRSLEPVVAIDRLALAIGRPGSVHGFLGPNGSGKTTTIRCMLGLIKPTEGSVQVFGADSTTSFHKVVGRVGAIVENPKMFPPFTGRKNLQLMAAIQGIPDSMVEDQLEVVGLRERGDDTFDSYSLGMKQRLAIAGALLKNPDLLILDEPANGLDPAGIAEMRVLIRSIAGQGKAVIVSSHQLSEIEQVCDDITIISQGHLVMSGTLKDVRSAYKGRQGVVVHIDGRDQAMAVLSQAGLPSRPLPAADQFIVDVEPTQAMRINQLLASNGHYLKGLVGQTATLEDVFLELTAPPPPNLGATPPPFAPVEGGAQ